MNFFRSNNVILSGENTRKLNSNKSKRASISYWILGLCNNYGYVVMLTAASDIIGGHESQSGNEDRNCTYLSTGAILLADIIPGLIIKLIAPFLPTYINLRVAICVFISALGFLLVAFSNSIILSILGVVLTSFCSGFGEVTFLQYSPFYSKNVVSTWSSGTGAAGVIGALSYTILQTLGFQTTLLIMLVVPLTMGFSFWIILPKPSDQMKDIVEIRKSITSEEGKHKKQTVIKKIKYIPSLLKYMIPFGLVYLFEYFINQGTFELVNFQDSIIDQKNQYRWLQVAYQIGVFFSRSSVNCIHIKAIWLMSILQFINVIIYTSEVIYYYMPNFWIVVVLTLWEGLLGGAAYVNTYYRISNEVSEERRQFSMAITSFADSIGITLAGVLAILAHNKICSLPLPSEM